MMKQSTIALLLFSVMRVSAQEYPSLEKDAISKDGYSIGVDDEFKTPNQVYPSTKIPDQNKKEWLKLVLELNADQDLQVIGEEQDYLGFVHTRYQLTYKSIPVEDNIYLVHSKDGFVKNANGRFQKAQELSVTPVLLETSAFNNAIAYFGAEKYVWEEGQPEDSPMYFEKPVGKLMIATVNNIQKIAYQFDIYTLRPIDRREYVYVDAVNGSILKTINRVFHADVQTNVTTKYSGNQTITTDSYNGSYRLREAKRGLSKGVATYNAKNSTNPTQIDFTDATNKWTSAADIATLDAHWGAEQVIDFYQQKFSRNSYDNKGTQLVGFIHYDRNLVNAYWTGSAMNYGDGDGSTYGPLVTLDIVGHEITHAVTQASANLTYQNESGALNESFSDIMGIAIDYFARPGKANFKIAEEASLPTAGKAFRDCGNPKADNYPNTYKGTYWATGTADNGGVHSNSLVQNYWYYLLCNGGSGTNDNATQYSISKIGLEKATAIAYRTLTVYLSASSNYNDSRTNSIKAAVDLYGKCSLEEIAVTNAWNAVGVGAAYSGTIATAAYSAANTFVCSPGTGVTFNNTSTNASTYSWDFGDGKNSTDANPTHFYANAGTYTVKLTATGTTAGCGLISTTEIKEAYITVGTELNPTVDDQLFCENRSFVLEAAATQAGNIIKWYADSTSNTPLATGTTYTTPVLSNTTLYFVKEFTSDYPSKIGPAGNTVGTGSNHAGGYGLIFDAQKGFLLKSVKVYANGAKSRTIQLKDASGAVIKEGVFNIPNGESRVALNWEIPQGNNFKLLSPATADLYRSDGGISYPYTVAGLLNIKNSDAPSPADPKNYYYYFYDWEIADPRQCISTPKKVTLTYEICTAIIDKQQITSESVHPNPVRDILYVDMQGLQAAFVYSLEGKLLKTFSDVSDNNTFSVEFLPEGMYQLVLEADNRTKTYKLIKM